MSHLRIGLTAAAIVLAGSATAQLSFTDVSGSSGAGFDHNTGGMSNWDYMGGGVVADFNGDGFQDIFAMTGGANGVRDKLYINQQDGTFSDEASAWDLDAIHKGRGASVADYDNDGDLDLYVTSAGPAGGGSGISGQHKLYRNDGGFFTDVGGVAGVNFTTTNGGGVDGDGNGSCWGDPDRDGDLDLFVAGFKNTNQGNRLFRNDGDGTFTDITVAIDLWGTTPISLKSFTPRFADMDGDGWPDLLIASDFGTNRYLKNDGDGTFTDVTNAGGLGAAENGMGGYVADWNNDGLRDWYVTSIWLPSFNWTGNKMHYNLGNHLYAEVSQSVDVHLGGYGWGTVGMDFNHDTRLDIVETNGDSGSFGQFAGEQSYLWLQNPDGTFTEAALATGLAHFGRGRGLANLDIENDGDQDLIIFANDEPVTVWRNDLIVGTAGPSDNWLRVFLDTSADDALPPNGYHSEVWATVGANSWMRPIDGGDNFLSMGELSAHFGLGPFTTVDELKVKWINGTETVLTNVAANQTLTIAAPGDTWTDLGDGKAGTGAITPVLAGTGPLSDGSLNSLDLTDALAGSSTTLVAGFTQLGAPFKGGVLVPNADIVIGGLPTGAGAFSLPFVWPSGVPAGISVYFQHWISDGGATFGLSASNGLQGTSN